MRKKILFSLATVLLIAVSAVSLVACSQDEAEEDAKQTKIELLKAKAKEFAKKYGVEMSLNEENIEALAETLTVEQMEEDFKAFAEFKDIASVAQVPVLQRTNRLKIKRTKTPEEERDTIYENEKEESQEVSCTCYGVKTGDDGKKEEIGPMSLSGKAKVRWKHGVKSVSEVYISLELKDPYSAVNGGGSLHSSFDSTSAFKFDAFGSVTAKGQVYTYYLYAYVSYVNETIHVSLSSDSH